MEKRPVLFLDSGIGGIPYCDHFHQKAPNESIVYLADRQHFPYGKLGKAEIESILAELAGKLIQAVNPKIAVLACNTATIAALPELRNQYPSLPIVGTVPAVKPAAIASRSGKIGVLGTAFTVRESHIRELAAQYGGAEITGIAAGELVDFVENRYFDAAPEEKEKVVGSYISRFRAAGVDSLVLGCTHFVFLREEFRRLASPDITVFESVTGITQRIESLLLENSYGEGLTQRRGEEKTDNGPAQKATGAKNRLLLTGPERPEPSWEKWAGHLGFELALLEDS